MYCKSLNSTVNEGAFVREVGGERKDGKLERDLGRVLSLSHCGAASYV